VRDPQGTRQKSSRNFGIRLAPPLCPQRKEKVVLEIKITNPTKFTIGAKAKIEIFLDGKLKKMLIAGISHEIDVNHPIVRVDEKNLEEVL